ncbi:hypothetical protein WR25_26959 [Diploscapter pachys]|uniref:Golgi SNAP receptor complex member 2 n=1 Tax=Diploscapter pachys TaxID=2018661 RepID=A0A2A2K346_9BILA|nr:hypothetical protein WR25_26959 [Diploscapter pachys]
MEQLYVQTNAILQRAQLDLGRLEQARDERDAQIISQSIHAQIRDVESNICQLDLFVGKEPPGRRQTARMKVDQLKHDQQSVSVALTAMYARLTTKWRAASEREELLTQRMRPNDSSTAISFDDHQLQMNDQLHNSHRQMDDLIGQGAAVLENLRSQHLNLRGVRRKIMDIGSTLGLSNTTISMIDRRVREDWVLMLVGMLLTLLFIYCFWSWWKGSTGSSSHYS